MKKILFLLSIVLFYSCTTKSDGSDTIQTKDGFVPVASVVEKKKKKHSYIKLADKGVVHDQDCQYCYDKFD